MSRKTEYSAKEKAKEEFRKKIEKGEVLDFT
jgi:hypothetical protein